MTSSPGLCGWSRLQARCEVLQTPTDDDRRQKAKQYWPRPPTLCVGRPVIRHMKVRHLVRCPMMLSQFACSLARPRWRQFCKSDMALTSTAHHVTVARERHKLTLCKQQRTCIVVIFNQFQLQKQNFANFSILYFKKICCSSTFSTNWAACRQNGRSAAYC